MIRLFFSNLPSNYHVSSVRLVATDTSFNVFSHSTHTLCQRACFIFIKQTNAQTYNCVHGTPDTETQIST